MMKQSWSKLRRDLCMTNRPNRSLYSRKRSAHTTLECRQWRVPTEPLNKSTSLMREMPQRSSDRGIERIHEFCPPRSSPSDIFESSIVCRLDSARRDRTTDHTALVSRRILTCNCLSSPENGLRRSTSMLPTFNQRTLGRSYRTN